MKRSTITLVLVASAVYYAILFLSRSFFPADFNPPLYFLVGPLLVLVLILVSDLSYRATVPIEVRVRNPPSRQLAREVQELTRQIQVADNASPAYFENVLLLRMREILAQKVALETSMDVERVREILANPHLGPRLLRDEQLYALLYTSPAGRRRVKLLEDAVGLVEAWKP